MYKIEDLESFTVLKQGECLSLSYSQNEIKNGYVTNITRRSAFGVASQVVTIQKNGIVYQLEVRGSEECTMGTAIFDENNYDWQLVYIKQYPDRESYSGHYMRIIL